MFVGFLKVWHRSIMLMVHNAQEITTSERERVCMCIYMYICVYIYMYIHICILYIVVEVLLLLRKKYSSSFAGSSMCSNLLLRFVNFGFFQLFLVYARSLTKPFFRPSQHGSCAWLLPFLLCADCTCVLVCVYLCMCM